MEIMYRKKILLLVIFLLISHCVFAQWTELTPGVDYREFTISGPNNLFVTRLNRSQNDCIIDSCLGQGKLISGRETVTSMVNRYDDIIGYWGQEWGGRYEVIAAINGDFWDMTNNCPQSGHIMAGWYSMRFTNFTGGSGFVWQLDRDAFIGGCINHRSNKNFVAYPATGQDQNITGVNVSRGADELVLYTEQWDDNTGTDNSGVEVLIEMTRPTLVLPSPSYASGTVKEIRVSLGATPLPFKHIVLSATGSAATKLQSNVSLGDEIRISQEISHYEKDCSTSSSNDWSKTYASIGGGFVFLKDGSAQTSSNTDRHPRTAVALNGNYVFFIVCDGRSTSSIGMTYADLADFCLNQLAASDGINQDGGGSSAIWVDGEIKNVPSDGSERATYNGLMMIKVYSKAQSTTFNTGDNVIAPSGASVRLGPGDQYGVTATASTGEEATISDESLNGIFAKGTNWWKVEYAGVSGWVEEGAIQLKPTSVGEWDIYE